MRTLMFYSYKGGAGRTVAAANVACALTKRGKRTAIIDLDFEAPGLHHIFGVEQFDACTSGLGIQSYLKDEINLDQLMTDATVDIFDEDGKSNIPLLGNGGPGERSERSNYGRLLYIVASSSVSLVDAANQNVGRRMVSLKKRLEDENFEFLVIDAASGVRESYAIAYDACGALLIFFRWSRQHVAGTLRMVQYLNNLRRVNRYRPYRLIASAAPDLQQTYFSDQNLRSELVQFKNETEAQISERLKKLGMNPPEIFFEIKELPEMKIREAVIVFRDENSPYEDLATKLVLTDIEKEIGNGDTNR